jgi:hypothetical protein
MQLGPLGTAATSRPIVSATGDYDDGEIGGMMIGKGNRSKNSVALVRKRTIPYRPTAAVGEVSANFCG